MCMRRAVAAILMSTALVMSAAPALAGSAYYKVQVCDVEVQKNKTVTENGTYTFTGEGLPEGDYVGECGGYAVKVRPGNRWGQRK